MLIIFNGLADACQYDKYADYWRGDDMSTKQTVAEMPGHLIRRLNQHSTAVFQDRCNEAGFDLTSVQFAAMSALDANPGIDQATLAGLIAYDRTTIGGVVDRLVRKGLVTRQVNETDRRARQLVLNDKGTQVLQEITVVVAKLQDEILAALSPEERRQFVQLAKKALRRD